MEWLRVHRRSEDGSFPRVSELTAEEHALLRSPLIPGLSLALDELFAPME